MRGKRYAEEFKLGAVKQVQEEGHSAYEVARRLGMSGDTLHRSLREYGKPQAQRVQERYGGRGYDSATRRAMKKAHLSTGL